MPNYFNSLKQPVSIIFMMIAILLNSCNKNDEPLPAIVTGYSFFVAGHTYGQPGVDNNGLHPPFQDKFDLINERKVEMGFLTGDIVIQGTEKNWDEGDSVLNFLDATTYFAAGNHDLTDRDLFESRYGNTYFDFTYKEDLFIVLDPNIDQWNISGDQLIFLKNVLNTKAAVSENIFVFFHQLLWWQKDNKYRKFYPNSLEWRADTINFWTEVEPIFHELTNQVYMFSGDIGAGSWSENYFFDHYDNITFMASGMGEGKGDNFVIVNVPENEDVTFELVPLYEEGLPLLINPKEYIFPHFTF